MDLHEIFSIGPQWANRYEVSTLWWSWSRSLSWSWLWSWLVVVMVMFIIMLLVIMMVIYYNPPSSHHINQHYHHCHCHYHCYSIGFAWWEKIHELIINFKKPHLPQVVTTYHDPSQSIKTNTHKSSHLCQTFMEFHKISALTLLSLTKLSSNQFSA